MASRKSSNSSASAEHTCSSFWIHGPEQLSECVGSTSSEWPCLNCQPDALARRALPSSRPAGFLGNLALQLMTAQIRAKDGEIRSGSVHVKRLCFQEALIRVGRVDLLEHQGHSCQACTSSQGGQQFRLIPPLFFFCCSLLTLCTLAEGLHLASACPRGSVRSKSSKSSPDLPTQLAGCISGLMKIGSWQSQAN